ncbi:MAG: sulfurtransferase [Microbacterium sp. 70-38]|nr:MAG: sulfurtransferase [Microbacterium sp. 70-38]
MALLISPDDLAAALRADAPPRVLDVRWRLDRPDGRPEYLAGHLPGAVFVDLETELARHGDPGDGRHPLPGRAELEAAARRWGLDDGDAVVVYDEGGALSAARAWWLLHRSGVADVRVLDGGVTAWAAAGLPLETGDVRPRHGTITLEPIDPLAGHIPGAVSLPTTDHLDDGRFRDAAEIRATFVAAGAEPGVPVAAYCGSGVTAAHTAFAGALAGIDVTVYPGSWSQWSNTPGRPVATGPQP